MGDGARFDRGLISSALIIACGIALYWAMFYDMGLQSGRHEERAHIEREHYAATAAQKLGKLCAGLNGTALTKCVYDVAETEHESGQSESELAAQRTSADSAFWAAVVAGAQLVTTIVGLYFIKGTLDASKEAVEDATRATRAIEKSNEIADKNGQAQVRAYLSIKPLAFRREGDKFSIRFTYVNSGQSPARFVNFECRVEAGGLPVCIPGMLPIGDIAANAPPAEEEWAAEIWKETAEFLTVPTGLVVWIIAHYEDVFEQHQADWANFTSFAKPGDVDLPIKLLPQKGMALPSKAISQ